MEDIVYDPVDGKKMTKGTAYAESDGLFFGSLETQQMYFRALESGFEVVDVGGKPTMRQRTPEQLFEIDTTLRGAETKKNQKNLAPGDYTLTCEAPELHSSYTGTRKATATVRVGHGSTSIYSGDVLLEKSHPKKRVEFSVGVGHKGACVDVSLKSNTTFRSVHVKCKLEFLSMPKSKLEVAQAKELSEQVKKPDELLVELVKGTTGVGMNLKWDKTYRAVVVSTVEEQGAAARAKLKVGDRIIAIQGKRLENASFKAAITMLRNVPSTVLLIIGSMPKGYVPPQTKRKLRQANKKAPARPPRRSSKVPTRPPTRSASHQSGSHAPPPPSRKKGVGAAAPPPPPRSSASVSSAPEAQVKTTPPPPPPPSRASVAAPAEPAPSVMPPPRPPQRQSEIPRRPERSSQSNHESHPGVQVPLRTPSPSTVELPQPRAAKQVQSRPTRPAPPTRTSIPAREPPARTAPPPPVPSHAQSTPPVLSAGQGTPKPQQVGPSRAAPARNPPPPPPLHTPQVPTRRAPSRQSSVDSGPPVAPPTPVVAPTPPAPVAASPSGGGPDMSKYDQMKAVGLPEGAIRNAMMRDSVEPPMGYFDSPSSTSAPTSTQAPVEQHPPTTSSSNVEIPSSFPGFEKYQRMQEHGLPEGAVRNAMMRDGVEPPSGFFSSSSGTTSSSSATPPVPPSVGATAGQPAPTGVHFPGMEKYERMKKTGLPEGAILNAMRRDGVTPPEGFFQTASIQQESHKASGPISVSQNHHPATAAPPPPAPPARGPGGGGMSMLDQIKSGGNLKHVERPSTETTKSPHGNTGGGLSMMDQIKQGGNLKHVEHPTPSENSAAAAPPMNPLFAEMQKVKLRKVESSESDNSSKRSSMPSNSLGNAILNAIGDRRDQIAGSDEEEDDDEWDDDDEWAF